APKPNPAIKSGIFATSIVGLTVLTTRNNIEIPSKHIATTNKPATAPPRRAVVNAPLRLVTAAAAVRMLVRIATHIPIYPAMTEHVAPRANDTTVHRASEIGETGSAEFCARKNA